MDILDGGYTDVYDIMNDFRKRDFVFNDFVFYIEKKIEERIKQINSKKLFAKNKQIKFKVIVPAFYITDSQKIYLIKYLNKKYKEKFKINGVVMEECFFLVNIK